MKMQFTKITKDFKSLSQCEIDNKNTLLQINPLYIAIRNPVSNKILDNKIEHRKFNKSLRTQCNNLALTYHTSTNL